MLTVPLLYLGIVLFLLGINYGTLNLPESPALSLQSFEKYIDLIEKVHKRFSKRIPCLRALPYKV
jgi:hypothetical protein